MSSSSVNVCRTREPYTHHWRAIALVAKVGLAAREGRVSYTHHWHARVHAFIVDPLDVVSEILPPVRVRVRVRG
jgi:hypothetical protein